MKDIVAVMLMVAMFCAAGCKKTEDSGDPNNGGGNGGGNGGSSVQYTIIVSANPTNSGTVIGGGTFDSGTSCTVKATANEGYTFANWMENDSVVSTNANYTFTVNANRTLKAHFTANAPNQYTISVSASPLEGGTVSGGGSFNSGTSRTVTATANVGYTFINWTENGNQVSDSASYTFTVTANRILVANFTANAPNQYSINVSANPTDGGVVSGCGTYLQGQSCTVRATAAAGYTFQKWTKNGTQVSTNSSYTFAVTASATYVAHFQASSYTISVSASPNNGGNVNGGGSYTYGQSCTVHATANNGYTFTNWTENGNQVSTNANYTFTVTGNRPLTANFTYNGGGNAPTGAINGVFSVGDSQRVYFSQGNLQYQASTSTWRFAEHQWDLVGGTQGGSHYGNVEGSSNNDISPTYSGWIDLFGWGTSGWNCGNTYYRPWDSDNSNYGSLYGPPGSYNLSDNYANSDWGVYNAISNGGNTVGQWRTLTSYEWSYVFWLRSDAYSKYGHGCVNGTNGMILLPDIWTLPSGLNFTPGNSSWTNNYTTEQWSLMQARGAVFLPTAGIRNGTSVYGAGDGGYYWSSSYFYSNEALYQGFYDDGLVTHHYYKYRYYGYSVRLVCPVE